MSSSLHQVKVHRRTNVKKILQDDRKRIRLFLLVGGVFLLGTGFLFSKTPSSSPVQQSQQVQDSLVSSFDKEPVKIDPNLIRIDASKKIVKNPPTRLIIPNLGIDVAVREAKIVKGYWEVFSDSAGFGEGSAYPQDSGNQVIFAHARPGLFLPLKEAKIGQKVYVFTKNSWYTYSIKDIKEVLPSQVGVIAPTTSAVLTLYTCSGFADSKRLIVTAEKN